MVLIYVLKLSNEPVQGLSTVKLLPGNIFYQEEITKFLLMDDQVEWSTY